MVLKRLFVVHPREVTAYSLLGPLGDRAHGFYMTVLLRRWAWKAWISVTLGKALLSTVIVQTSQETEFLGVGVLAVQGLILDNIHFVRMWWA